MRGMAWVMIGLLCAAGCSGRKSSLLLERQARGPLDEEPAIAKPTVWTLTPVLQTQTKNAVEVTANFASWEFLKHFFANKAIFGTYAGKPPFYPEYLVFYVKFANRSDKKIRINPPEFAVVDDRGNQYGSVGVDYITAFAEYRKPMASTSRSMIESASPGYFGISFPVGRLLAQKPQGQFAQLQQSALHPGDPHPRGTDDGLIAFWSPTPKAAKLRLIVANVKTDFDANDFPKTAMDFVFDFDAASQP